MSAQQLRFLFLAAALLAVRPADVVVLNEPESSLHANLLAGLAQLIAAARTHDTQVIVTTHAAELTEPLVQRGDAKLVRLELVGGATVIRE